MEDVIQIVVFCIIIISVIISKYKEVHANRPGQVAQKTIQPDRYKMTDDDIYTSDEEFTDDEIFTQEGLQDLNDNEHVQESFNKKIENVIESPTISQLQTKYEPSFPQPIIPKEKTHHQTIVKPTSQTEKRQRIRLKTRNEARKAFI